MFQFKVIDASEVKSAIESNKDVKHEFQLDDRVVCDADVGTVKYIGPVDPHPGLWLGVEWDEASRGKHDGVVNGKRYFETSKSGAGSFVRLSKVKKCKTVTEAINERYGEDPDLIQFVEDIAGGLERRRVKLSNLTILDVRSRQIFNTEEPRLLSKMCPKLEVVIVANNHIRDWNAIGNLCLGLDRLKELDVSDNPLEPVTCPLPELLESVFQSLNLVVMSTMNYDWENVRAACLMWKNVSDLRVLFNRITTLSLFLSPMEKLRTLDLSGNSISEWGEVMKLKDLNSLENLNLADNKIAAIEFNDAEKKDPSSILLFPKLAKLNLSGNKIQAWTSVNELAVLPSLVDLRIDTNPFLQEDSRVNNRQNVIARLPYLRKLEGVQIERSEKRDAELDWVKSLIKEYQETNKEKFLELNPRFLTLVQEFGLSDLLDSVGPKQPQKTTINLALVGPNQKIIHKELPLTMTVQKLRVMLQRLFSVPGKQLYLTAESSKNPEVTFELDNDFYDFAMYSLEDCDKVYVNTKSFVKG